MGDRLLQGRGLALTATLVALPLAAAAALAPLPAMIADRRDRPAGMVALNAFGLLLVVVATFPWDDMLGYPSPELSVTKLLGALLLLAYVLQALGRSERLRAPGNLLPLAVFEGAACSSPCWSARRPADGLIKTLRYALFGVFTIASRAARPRPGQLHRVVVVLGGSACLAAALGLFNFLTGAQTRASGPIGKANDFAYLLASVLPLVVYLALQSDGGAGDSGGRASRCWASRPPRRSRAGRWSAWAPWWCGRC